MIDVAIYASSFVISGSLPEALEACRNKLVVKKYHRLVSGKWQHLDSHKNSKVSRRLYSKNQLL